MNEKIELIKEIKTLLNSPIVTTFFGFLLGVTVQIITSIIKKIKNKREFNFFESMIMDNYIKPYNKQLDKYFNIADPTNVSDLKEYIKVAIRRLNYLKEQEIYFLKTDNQFKMIRLIEFTKEYLTLSNEALNKYTFRSPIHIMEEYDRESAAQKAKLKRLKKQYQNKKNKYLKLEIDKLD